MGDRIWSRPISKASGKSLSVGGRKPPLPCRLDRGYTRRTTGEPGWFGARNRCRIALSCGTCDLRFRWDARVPGGTVVVCASLRAGRRGGAGLLPRGGGTGDAAAERFPWHTPEVPHPALSSPDLWGDGLLPVFVRAFEAGAGWIRPPRASSRARYVPPTWTRAVGGSTTTRFRL